MHGYRWNTILVMPEDLIAYAWSAPMRDLAKGMEMSDVGLRKLLTSHGVSPPPQGYWNKVRAGKPVPDPPRPRQRRPGETGRCRVDQRLGKFVPRATPMLSAGPFASRHVPENLDELHALERKAIGKTTVPKSLERYHPGLAEIIKKEAKRRAKAEEGRWHWDEPKFDNPLDQRRLRFLNGLFLALARRGHSGSVHESNEDIEGGVTIGDTYMRLSLAAAGKHRTELRHGYRRPARDLPATTPLMLQLRQPYDRGVIEAWQDDDAGKLESKLAEIVTALIVTGEREFREGLRRDEECAEQERIEREAREEQERIERERQRLARLEELHRQRIDALLESGRLMREAAEIRALIPQVREALASRADVGADALDAWEVWARAEADRLDPVHSGQILQHLQSPIPDQE